MKNYLLTFVASSISVLFFYFLGFESLIMFFGLATLILGILLSGTAVSGDRMRANSQHEAGFSKHYYFYFIVVSIPYLVTLIFLKLI
ncbi:hypothetical protein BAU15_08295 [Enterococcus sp. JM4C]|uniref:hypothetical protein n=1 Tax=Candidatus Enterococcus huntleyi TaxID=1857217 RepID=UPI001379CBAC|nr:hypothetical protein [Enterococcus sp. JM4C]KAF1297895.1 hypothetical protein BAU15_08295 [Enterococcus sp. JM4C]